MRFKIPKFLQVQFYTVGNGAGSYCIRMAQYDILRVQIVTLQMRHSGCNQSALRFGLDNRYNEFTNFTQVTAMINGAWPLPVVALCMFLDNSHVDPLQF